MAGLLPVHLALRTYFIVSPYPGPVAGPRLAASRRTEGLLVCACHAAPLPQPQLGTPLRDSFGCWGLLLCVAMAPPGGEIVGASVRHGAAGIPRMVKICSSEAAREGPAALKSRRDCWGPSRGRPAVKVPYT